VDAQTEAKAQEIFELECRCCPLAPSEIITEIQKIA
jgi:hypothetical protein